MIEKSILGVAGEFAVAAELCRRNVYAQLTLGNQKRVDLLTMSRGGRLLRVEVKTKQGPTWPSIKGVGAGEGFLVLVDFAGVRDTERAAFFVLSADDWRTVATRHIEEYRQNHPDRTPYLDQENCPVFPEELNARGKPYRGCSVHVPAIESYRDAWSKILDACERITGAEPLDSTSEQ